MKTDVWYDYIGKTVRIKGNTGKLSCKKHDIDEVIEVKTNLQAVMCKWIESAGGLLVTPYELSISEVKNEN